MKLKYDADGLDSRLISKLASDKDKDNWEKRLPNPILSRRASEPTNADMCGNDSGFNRCAKPLFGKNDQFLENCRLED